MKIIFVYDAIYPYVKGGGEKRIYDISRRLADRGHEVHLFGMKFWSGPDVIQEGGVHLHGVCPARGLYTSSGRRSICQALYFSANLLPPLLKADFDLVDCSVFPYFPCFSAKIACLLKRKPLVLTWYEVWRDYWREYLGILKGLIGEMTEKAVSMLAKRNIAISDTTKKNLVKLGVAEEKITVLPNGIDLDVIRETAPSGDESDVIFAGRLIADKNVDVLIKAVRLAKEKISGIRCIIIGDGPERGRLTELTVTLGLQDNVKFTGFLDYGEVIAHMKASKVFVLPSTREGFGIVVVEANACGLPVITAKHERNAAADLIDEGKNGFKCELSEKELAEKILAIVGDDSLRKKMSEHCLEHSKKYDWGMIADDAEKYYRKTISNL